MSDRQPARRQFRAIALATAGCAAATLALTLPTAGHSLAGPTTIRIEPDVATVEVGEVFTLGVTIQDVVDLMAFQVSIAYQPAVLRYEASQLGPFLGSTGRSVRPLGPVLQPGTVSLGATSLPGAPGPSGGGVLALLGFRALAEGESSIVIHRVELSDTHNAPITDTMQVDGLVIVSRDLPEPSAYLPYASQPTAP